MLKESNINEKLSRENSQDYFDALRNIRQLAMLRNNNKEASRTLASQIDQYEKKSIEFIYELGENLDGYITRENIDNTMADTMKQVYRELMISRVNSINVPSITDYVTLHTFNGDRNKQNKLLNLLAKFNLLPQKAA